MAKKLKFNPSDIEKLYKAQSTVYSDFAMGSFSWKYLERPLIDKVLSMLSTKDPRILDAGCGMGRTLKHLVDKKIKYENILGVDISSEMLAIAKKHAPQVRTIKSDLISLRVKEKFDLIICTHVMHYLDEDGFRKVLRNYYKLLNKGGFLFFVITHPIRTTRHNLSEYFKRDWIIDHTPWGTDSPLFIGPITDIVNATIEAGFVIKSLDEPDVPLKAKKSDLNNYLKYSSCPSRIAVIAQKP